jgi:hypothetical protein
VLAGRATETFMARLRRLERFRNAELGVDAELDEACPDKLNVRD